MAWIRTETKEQSGTTYKDIEELNLMSHSFFTLTFIYSVTKGGGGIGAPQIAPPPVSSIFLWSSLPSGAW